MIVSLLIHIYTFQSRPICGNEMLFSNGNEGSYSLIITVLRRVHFNGDRTVCHKCKIQIKVMEFCIPLVKSNDCSVTVAFKEAITFFM